MKGRIGTSMSVVRTHKKKPRPLFTEAGPVKVTQADGTVATKGAYNRWQVLRIVGDGQRREKARRKGRRR